MQNPKLIRHEGHFRGYENVELFYQTWSSEERRPRATIVLTHGMSEHSECYHRTAEELVPMGWDICAWDLRGHGRSEGKRGVVGNFHNYVLDFGYFLKHLKSTGKLEGRFALLGHSMGGLVTLRHLVDQVNDCPVADAVALSSPLLGIAVEVPVLKDLAARVLYRFAPNFTMFNELHYDRLTRDPDFRKGYDTDPLRHDKVSPGIFLGMLENMAVVKTRAAKIKLPLLIQAAGEDQIVSLQAIKDFFPQIGSEDKKLIVYNESYHEIFNDLDRMKVFRDLDVFLTRALTGRVESE